MGTIKGDFRACNIPFNSMIVHNKHVPHCAVTAVPEQCPYFCNPSSVGFASTAAVLS